MPRTSTSPRFTEANKLFLYRLLRDQLGCGKQTFITRVEEALAQERMTAEDLGFDSTLQLLEALGPEVVKITLFKGGRAYATLIAREDWDKALAAPETKAPAKGNKPWKRKKGDKSLKPSCPKRVKREAAPAPSEKPVDAPAAEPAADAAKTSESVQTDALPVVPDKAASMAATAQAPLDEAPAEAAQKMDEAPAETDLDPEKAAGTGESKESPRIALTVTYDPYTGQEGESSLVATQEELARRAAEKAAAEAAKRAAQEATAAAARAVQIARERRAAMIAAAIAEREAQKEAEAAHVAPSPTDASPAVASPAAASAATPDTTAAAVVADEKAHVPGAADARPAQQDQGNQADSASVKEVKPCAEPSLDQAASHQPSPTTETARPLTNDANAAATTDAAAATPVARNEQDAGAKERPALALPSDFPLDFGKEVFCPSALLHTLTLLYPYGADVMGIVSEYCLIARERGSIEATRSRASFSIYFISDGHRATAEVTIRRRRDARRGAAWAVESVTVIEEDVGE